METIYLTKVQPGDHIEFPVNNHTTVTTTGTVLSRPRRRDRSYYYFIDVELEDGRQVMIQRHKNTTFRKVS